MGVNDGMGTFHKNPTASTEDEQGAGPHTHTHTHTHANTYGRMYPHG